MANGSESADWSPKKKWWMDLIKSVIVFSIASVLTILFINKINNDRARNEFKWRTEFAVRVDAISELSQACSDYSGVAYDVMKGNFELRKNPSEVDTVRLSKDENLWKNTLMDRYRAASDLVDFWFCDEPEVRSALEGVRYAADEIYREYRALQARDPYPAANQNWKTYSTTGTFGALRRDYDISVYWALRTGVDVMRERDNETCWWPPW